MGGAPKGLMRTPGGETIVGRWRSVFDALGIPVVLVGAHDGYASLALEMLADDPPGIGPLGGLVALLMRAGTARAIAVACDMPYVSRALVERLARAPSAAAIIAPRRDGRWEPLFARYDAPLVLPIARTRIAAGRHALQGLLDEARADELPLAPEEMGELRDWDSPSDVPRDPS
jgi:molybdopterin-guanine dinucleotide biosynthesis protein A